MILENNHEELLVVKCSYKNYWSLPGGVVDEKEAPKNAAIREVFEEVGVTLAPENVSFLRVIYRRSREIDTLKFIFRSSFKEGATYRILLQESEIEDYAFVSKDTVKLKDHVYAQEVIDWSNDETSSYQEQEVDS